MHNGPDEVRAVYFWATLSSPGLTGRSSIPEALVIEPISRGVLDRPPSRAMTAEFNLAELSHGMSGHKAQA
jgi:hypothetical protein